jgi:hypothetical protein
VAGLLWLVEAIVLGCLLAWRFAGLSTIRPAWASAALIFAAGAAGGIGLTSCLFFVGGALLGSPASAMIVELAGLAWLGYDAIRRRAPAAVSDVPVRTPLFIPIAAVLLVVVGIATAAMATAWDANPQGNWDGWAIWNLRARFLASGAGISQRAWSPILGATTHAEYPLLVSGFVARCWSYSRVFSSMVPAATSYVFFLALLALAAGGIAALRGSALGMLAALALAGTPSLLREVPAQYADVPLACYIAGAVVFALLDRPVLAGLFAGLAAWTKDEGLLFLLLFLAAATVFRPKAALATIAGALPGALLAAGFKALLATGNGSLLSSSIPEAGSRIFDAARYGAVITAYGHEFFAMAAGWYHPILPLIVLAIALRLGRERRREAIFCGVIFAALLAGYFGVYILTRNDLAWQLQTSLGRLFVQVWPPFVLAAFLSLRAPEAAAIVTVPPPTKVRRKAKR